MRSPHIYRLYQIKLSENNFHIKAINKTELYLNGNEDVNEYIWDGLGEFDKFYHRRKEKNEFKILTTPKKNLPLFYELQCAFDMQTEQKICPRVKFILYIHE